MLHSPNILSRMVFALNGVLSNLSHAEDVDSSLVSPRIGRFMSKLPTRNMVFGIYFLLYRVLFRMINLYKRLFRLERMICC